MKKKRASSTVLAIVIISLLVIIPGLTYAASGLGGTDLQEPGASGQDVLASPTPTADGEPAASTEPTMSPEPTPAATPEPTASLEPTTSPVPSTSPEPTASLAHTASLMKPMALYTSVNSDATFNSAISSATGTAQDPDVIEITGDFLISSTKTIPLGKYIKLVSSTGNQFKLSRGLTTINLFDVQGSLTLENIIIDGEAWGTSKYMVKVSTGASFTMGSGSVLQRAWYNSSSGGAVYNDGTFALNGGEIKNNLTRLVSNVSGGVIFNAGTFTMSSGKITGNIAADTTNTGDCSVYGGVIYNTTGGNFTMSGGIIGGTGSDINKATAYDFGSLFGGAVYNSGTFSMKGSAKIQGTTLYKIAAWEYTTFCGGAVYNSGTFTMADSAEICETHATDIAFAYVNGLGVYSTGSSAELKMMDWAKVRNNNASTLDGNVNLKGGGVYNVQGSRFAMEWEAEISGNQLSATSGSCYGAGVYIENTGSLFTMRDNAKICDNTETTAGNTYGGGVYMTNNAQSVLNYGNISGNSATSTGNGSFGGGVYSYNGTTFTMNGGSITDNSTNASTAGSWSRGGGVFTSNATFNMSGGTISSNEANNAAGANSEGGGVFNWNIMNMTGGTITGNTAFKGGGIFNCTTLSVSGDSSITANTASVEGGGVEASTGTFTYTGGTIAGNTAPKGAGVLNGATFNMGGGAVDTDNDVYLNSGKVINVTTALTGPSPYAKLTPATYATGTTVVSLDASLTATGYTSKFSVTPSGAKWGLRANGQNLELVQEDVFLNGESGNDTNNGVTKATAVATFDKAKTLLGPNGTIYVCGTVTVASADEFSWSLGANQTMKRYKDPVDPENDFRGTMIQLDGSLTLSDIILDGGSSDGIEPTSPILQINGGTLNLNGGSAIQNNNLVIASTESTVSGSGVAGNGDITLNGGKIKGNTINILAGDFETAQGAGICLTGGILTLTDGEISGNAIHSRYGMGGGIYVAGSSFTMSGGTIGNNLIYTREGETGGAGGGIYIESDGTFNLQGGTIGGSANTAEQGGGIYCAGSMSMSAGTIQGNSAAYGGGVHFTGSTFTMSGGGICYNDATSHGGGLYLGQGVFDMSGDSSISGNTAVNDGGGVYFDGGRFNLSGGATVSQDNPVYLNGEKGVSNYITVTDELTNEPAVWVVPVNIPTMKQIVKAASANYTGGTGADILPHIALADEMTGLTLTSSGNNVNIIKAPLSITAGDASTDYTGSAASYNGEATGIPDDLTLADFNVWYKAYGSADSTYTTTEPVNAGEYSVKLELTGNENYWDTVSNTATFTINAIDPALSAFPDQQAEYTDAAFAITAPNVAGVLAKDTASAMVQYSHKVKSSGEALKPGLPKDAGIYTVQATYTNSPNYTEQTITKTVTIQKAALTATAEDVSRPFGTESVLAVSYTGFKGDDDESAITTEPKASTTATRTSGTGDYPISVSGGSAMNYGFTYVPGTLTILPLTDAQVPVFTKNLSSGYTFTQNERGELKVEASVSDYGTLSYQWYKNTASSTVDGAPIAKATGNAYRPLTSKTGTAYYYVVVTNTNNNATNKTASAVSNIAKVRVVPEDEEIIEDTGSPTPVQSPSPAAVTPTPAPSNTPAATPQQSANAGKTIPSDIIGQDETKGTITLEINVDDLPEGTTAIQLGDGEIIPINGKRTIRLEIKVESFNEEGKSRVVALDDEKVPLASFQVQASQPAGGKGATMPVVLWVVVGIAGAGALTLILILILRKKRAKGQ